MQKINKSEWIAISLAVAFLAYLFFGSSFMNLFNINAGAQGAEDNRPTLPETGVEVRDIVLGSGEEVRAGDTLTVHYVGILTDGRVFDSSLDRNTPFVFELGAGDVIRGWDEGLVGMKVGGRRQLIIAPNYAYGSRAVGAIPPDSTLVFEVELLDADRSE